MYTQACNFRSKATLFFNEIPINKRDLLSFLSLRGPKKYSKTKFCPNVKGIVGERDAYYSVDNSGVFIVNVPPLVTAE